PPDRAVVVEVIDGDTVRLQLGDAREDVRLIGIDTPETKHPTKPVECFGPEASAFLARLLPVGATLRVERDMEGRDSYRRLLLYLVLPTSEGERFVNLELVARVCHAARDRAQHSLSTTLRGSRLRRPTTLTRPVGSV
ncbi:MAG: thermonuclease family protein, partial [Actinomycetota bacterium]